MAFYQELQAQLAKAESAADSKAAATELIKNVETALALVTQEDRALAAAAKVDLGKKNELNKRRAELDSLLIAARQVAGGFSGRDIQPLEGDDAEVDWRRAQAGSPGDTLEIDVHKLMEDKSKKKPR